MAKATTIAMTPLLRWIIYSSPMHNSTDATDIIREFRLHAKRNPARKWMFLPSRRPRCREGGAATAPCGCFGGAPLAVGPACGGLWGTRAKKGPQAEAHSPCCCLVRKPPLTAGDYERVHVRYLIARRRALIHAYATSRRRRSGRAGPAARPPGRERGPD